MVKGVTDVHIREGRIVENCVCRGNFVGLGYIDPRSRANMTFNHKSFLLVIKKGGGEREKERLSYCFTGAGVSFQVKRREA